jgi:negative regulator of flagellin synthesis FlgM
MMINPLNPFDNVRKVSDKSNVGKVEQGELKGKSDSVEISSEATKRLQENRASELAKAAPDIRQEKVDEMRQIIANGQFESRYMNREVLTQVADRIADTFLGNE